MKALLIGTDFLKDVDGGYKMIETNTNIALSVNPNVYLDKLTFENFILSSGFTEIYLIYHEKNVYVLDYSLELEPSAYHPETGVEILYDFNSYLKDFCDANNITYFRNKVDENSVTVPYIEDSPNKLIIRVSYDTTALIDDTYARDNWEFLKLMYDTNPSTIAKTYINDPLLGFDSIGTTIRDNGNHPNYCVKKRITPSNNNIYPKLFKITTTQELDNLKNTLAVDEYIQEYIYDPTEILGNKHKHYRSVDMIYGPDLDVMNLWVAEDTNILDMVSLPDYDDNNKVQNWDRPRYTSKSNRNTSDIAKKFSADENTKIIKDDDTIIVVNQINVGDVVKSLDIPGLPHDYSGALSEWTGDTTSIISNFSVSAATLNSKTSYDYFGDIIEIETQNGIIFSDVPHARIFKTEIISGTSVTKMVGYELLSEGDNILLYDRQTNQIIEEQILDIRYSMEETIGYSLDFESLDLFLTLEETQNNNRYGIITHNYTYDCRYWSCTWGTVQCGWGGGACFRCGTGVAVPCCLPNGGVTSACCRDDNGDSFPYLGQQVCQYWAGGCNNTSTYHSAGSYCNVWKGGWSPPPST